MDAVKYLKERDRMCGGSNCWECPLYEKNNGKRVNCQVIEKEYAEKAVEIVEKWSAEHPIKTRQSELLKMFPNVEIKNDIVTTCPKSLDQNIKCESLSCDECTRKFWLAEVE